MNHILALPLEGNSRSEAQYHTLSSIAPLNLFNASDSPPLNGVNSSCTHFFLTNKSTKGKWLEKLVAPYGPYLPTILITKFLESWNVWNPRIFNNSNRRKWRNGGREGRWGPRRLPSNLQKGLVTQRWPSTVLEMFHENIHSCHQTRKFYQSHKLLLPYKKMDIHSYNRI